MTWLCIQFLPKNPGFYDFAGEIDGNASLYSAANVEFSQKTSRRNQKYDMNPGPEGDCCDPNGVPIANRPERNARYDALPGCA
jgi:hypothetical protein